MADISLQETQVPSGFRRGTGLQPVLSAKMPWVWLAICALGLIVYLNILSNGFVFDDWQQIVENPFLRRPDGLRKIFGSGVWQFLGPVGVSNFYRPLMHASFYGAFRLFGLNPAGYHAFSLLLHAAVSLLVYAVIARVGRDRLTAAAAALLFATHPVHTEAVAWISAYPELLCALFSLLAIWLYLGAEEACGSTRLVLSLLTGPALLLALLSKEIAAVVPAILVCYEFFVRRPRGPKSQVPSSKSGGKADLGPGTWDLGLIPYVSMAAAFSAYLLARLHALGALFPARSKPVPPWEHLWTAIALFYRYLLVQVWPLRLHAFYYLDRNRGPLEPAVIAGLAVFIATLVLARWLYRRGRAEVLAVPLYLLPLAPAFLLPYASVGLLMAERYVYLSSVGFCWLMAAGLVAAGRRWGHRAALALLLALLAGYSARTVLRNRDWADEIAFYRRTIADFPGFPRAYLNLGEALMRRNRLPEALEATQAAARLDPRYPDPHVNLGLIYRMRDDREPAIREFRQAAQLGEQDGNRFVVSRALADLATVYRSEGRLDEAVAASRRALAADPQFAGAHNNLGYALLLQGRTEEAVRHLRAAVDFDPTLDVAWSNLGLAFAMQREWGAAMGFLRRAEQLNPRSGEIQARIGEIHLAQGARDAAREQFGRALRLDPVNQRAIAGLRAAAEAQ